ncbi:uncharacterized protein LOC121370279 isoform X2 [Gigantopelta aegis]|nr:uncharacterized protein LOC121370279 isoform X2 [Gigantopelta aegis]
MNSSTVNPGNITINIASTTTPTSPITTRTPTSTASGLTPTTNSTGPGEKFDTNIAIGIGVAAGVLILVVVIIVAVVLTRRRRLKRPKKVPPTLPPPYPPTVNDISTHGSDQRHESMIGLANSDSLDPEQLNHGGHAYQRSTSVNSTSSSYIEPQTWVGNQDSEDKDEKKEQQQPTDDDFYICMEPGQPVISACVKKNILPHHELVYSETDIAGEKAASDSPKPCDGTNRKHGYVNVPSGGSNDTPLSPNDDETSPKYANCEQGNNQGSSYANLQEDGKPFARTTTLPKYSNIAMVKPDDIERFTPKSSPASKQRTAGTKGKTEKAKRLKDGGAGSSKTNILGPNKFSSTRSEGHYANEAIPPKTLPKPSTSKQKDTDDDERDKDYVNVSTKLSRPPTHGCKEEFSRVFQSKKHTTR